jgi:hypothetical protein
MRRGQILSRSRKGETHCFISGEAVRRAGAGAAGCVLDNLKRESDVGQGLDASRLRRHIVSDGQTDPDRQRHSDRSVAAAAPLGADNVDLVLYSVPP